jgi:ATP-dependent exoDNAse (exonuclease V) beta subunit
MMRIATFSPLFTNKAVHEMKSRIVGSLSEFAKTNLLKSAGFNAGFSDGYSARLFKLKPNHNKSSSISFITMLLLIFRLSINLRTKLSVLLRMI